eukprot:2152791-Prymnesium_polylepis.1
MDGDMVAELTGDASYQGMLVDVSPLLAFERFVETRHTGAALARSKAATLKEWNLTGAIGLATEDGASNNKSANRLLGQDQMACTRRTTLRPRCPLRDGRGGLDQQEPHAEGSDRALEQAVGQLQPLGRRVQG